MLTFVGWIILLAILTAAAPLVGMVLGLLMAGMVLRTSDAWAQLWEKHPSAVGFDLTPASSVTFQAPWQNLPGRLLHERQRPFRLDCIESGSGQRRAYTILAKHSGAATMKARAWGETLRAVHELDRPEQPTTDD